MTTREIILDKALFLFSKFGYSDVSMKDIANEVGIKAPSIYKHFKSKEEIFDTILNNAIISLDEKIHDAEDYKIIRDGKKSLNIEKLAIDIFSYLLNDSYVSRVRKMISIEMYKNPQAMKFYVDRFIETPMRKQEEIINYYGLSKYGSLKVISTIFYSPILFAIKLHDANPEKEEELLELLKDTYKKLEYIL
ncbi:TetR/AcrR family transcriptional regulator [Anaerococcus sp. WCA-380-WT-2B]|uniref:TetR/AcrR family transcriptional regulator n=1 Tax=Anaerococcus porci TaxID=2652269 RepID=A0A6N7VEF5_9FIRM|nr:TetR/AcrR family transcriptional regulator [Anaerococcus porci]MSS77820.1 TetR/AcrR family transcriptional regulator [Anaerococcus porci]